MNAPSRQLGKRLGKWLLGTWPCRRFTLALIAGVRLGERAISQARLRALVPGAKDAICHWSCEIKCPHNLRLGHRVVIGPRCTLGAGAAIVLGDHVRLSKGVIVETAGLDFSTAPPYRHTARPITIEAGVWLGTGAIVLGGVTIGTGSIIGAGTVISRDVPAFSIVTGAAPVVRPRRGSRP